MKIGMVRFFPSSSSSFSFSLLLFLYHVAPFIRYLTSFNLCAIIGEIIAEQIDWSRTQTRYRGLHFPETDIPCQARELYAVSPLRLLADVSLAYFSFLFPVFFAINIEVVS